MAVKYWLMRAHLWIGEALGLTHYRNCWTCKRCKDLHLGPSICGCNLYEHEDRVIAITDPSEAVWCLDYERND